MKFLRNVRLTWIVVLAMAAVALVAMRPSLVSAADPAPDVSTLILTAQRQFDSGNYWIAIKTLQSAVAQNSLSAEAYYWLGRCYYEVRDFDDSIALAERAVTLDVKNSLYHQWLGRAYGGKADQDRSFFVARKVKKELQEAVRLNPANVAARQDLADFCSNAPWIVGGSKDEARAQVDAIAALDPVAGHVARAKFDLDGLNRPDLAESELRQVLSSKPKSIEPYFEVIAFFQKQNKTSDMQAAIEDAAQISPNDPRLSYFRGTALVMGGADLGQAEEYLKSYLATSPDRSDWPPHAAAREWLGRIYEAQGKTAEAAEQYRASLRLQPGRKDAQLRLQKLENVSH
ncbi:MAG: tetratricopeptide repeat protein [Candidatus Acidiferrales bacterium]